MQFVMNKKVLVNPMEIMAKIQIQKKKEAYQKLLSNIIANSNNPIKSLSNELTGVKNEVITSLSCRILQHFIDEDLIDNNYHLTKKGKFLAENGIIDEVEQGKYFLWIVRDDMLKTSVIHFERSDFEDKRKESESEPFEYLNIRANQFFDYVNNTGFTISNFIANNPNAPPYKLYKNYSSLLNLKWDLRTNNNLLLDSSIIEITGSINLIYSSSDNKINIKKQDKFDNIDIEEFIRELFNLRYEWNFKYNAVELSFQQIPRESLETFTIDISFDSISFTRYGNFDTCKCLGLVIIASDKETAYKWFIEKVKRRVEPNYFVYTKFSAYFDEFRNKLGMDRFYFPLQSAINDICDELLKEPKADSYWHFQTCLDIGMDI